LTKKNKKFIGEINPDEIFLDSSNLPEFDTYQFEGRLEKPITSQIFATFGLFIVLVTLVFVGRIWNLQIKNGKFYADRALNNSLKQDPIFANRGIIEDRNGINLAWDEPSLSLDFAKRDYIKSPGFGHLLGFIKYPAKDSAGFYYRTDYEPQDGLELSLNKRLAGQNGLKITETDVKNKIVSESQVQKPVEGGKILLSIDAMIQEKMYTEIKALSEKAGFQGGAGLLMDVNSGEMIAMTSYPEYEPLILTEGSSTAVIKSYAENPEKPFLNRIISGLYAPGSIVKPLLAFAALEENIIDPETQIVTNGKLVVPNPYFPDKPSVFLDWKNHGAVDMRHALAVSSDVYFYQLGGGFEAQPGLGIEKIDKYFRMFGFGSPTGVDIGREEIGNIPTPEWKRKVFDEPWRLGDTYHTAIGQYGMLVTPVQIARAIAAIANGGTLVTPTFLKSPLALSPTSGKKIEIKNPADLQIVREGMRLSIQIGTSKGLDMGETVHIAGKTGTAEIGAEKRTVNSWTVGFFPYENPRYAYVIVMEKGPVKNLVGATSVMRQVMDWMVVNTPEYLTSPPLRSARPLP